MVNPKSFEVSKHIFLTLKQEDRPEFEAIRGYMVGSDLSTTTKDFGVAINIQ